MNNGIQLARRGELSPDVSAPDDNGSHFAQHEPAAPAQIFPDSFDVYAMLHRALRGRYTLASWLAVVGALCGATFAYFMTAPVYKSEGLLRVAHSRPAVMHETDQNKPMAMFESFLRSQQMKISSRGLVEQALATDIWRSTGRGSNAATLEWFADNMKVDHPPGTEHLRIAFVDFDPQAASTAVKALIAAFQAEYDNKENELQSQRIKALEERRKQLSDQLTTLGSRADQLALMDSMLSEYLKRQVTLENELRQLEIQGYLENHRRVAELRQMLNRTRELINQYSQVARQLRSFDRDYAAVAPKGDPRGLGGASDQINSPQLWPKATNQDVAQRDLISVQANMMQMQRLQHDGENIRKQLADTTDRMEALKVEAGIGSRLEVISSGDVPLSPFKDRRRLFALAGAGVGGTLPWVVLVALGLLHPAYRGPDDAIEDLGDDLPLLGTVPALSNRMSDLVLSAGAAQSIHQMRVKLQNFAERGLGSMFLLTSACPGEGKTSIATSLGLSFSASGSRTLLIDLDLVGKRLSRGFRAENRNGAYEALLSGELGDGIREITPTLSVLPAGVVDPEHACTIPAASVSRLLAQVRGRYDFILIDSGPALGSVETSLAAPEADGVVLTIARGQLPTRVRHTIAHLESLGAQLVGTVFNKAEPRQFQRSSYGSSLAHARYDRQRMGSMLKHGSDPLKYDLMVRSVMTFLPPGRNDSGKTALPEPAARTGKSSSSSTKPAPPADDDGTVAGTPVGEPVPA